MSLSELYNRVVGFWSSEDDDIDERSKIKEYLFNFNSNGSVDMNEINMMLKILDLNDKTVKTILVPQPDVVSIPKDLHISDIQEYISEESHTRYPVVAEDGNSVSGYIDVKDILQMRLNNNVDVVAGDVARDIPIVPESATIFETFQTIKSEQKQIVAVIDEWGSLEGIVTVEDIMEVVFGDIKDEFDNPDSEPSVQISDGEYISDGSVPVSEINTLIGKNLETDDTVETVGGIILSNYGEVPEVGDTVTINNIDLTVEEMDNKRISLVKISGENF